MNREANNLRDALALAQRENDLLRIQNANLQVEIKSVPHLKQLNHTKELLRTLYEHCRKLERSKPARTYVHKIRVLPMQSTVLTPDGIILTNKAAKDERRRQNRRIRRGRRGETISGYMEMLQQQYEESCEDMEIDYYVQEFGLGWYDAMLAARRGDLEDRECDEDQPFDLGDDYQEHDDFRDDHDDWGSGYFTADPADKDCTARELCVRYNGTGSTDYPNLPRTMWQDKVLNMETTAGYWEWVLDVLNTQEL